MESVVRVWTAGPKEPGGKQEPVQPRLAAESLPGWAGGREAGGREALGPRDPQGEQRRRGRWGGACPSCSGRGGQCLDRAAGDELPLAGRRGASDLAGSQPLCSSTSRARVPPPVPSPPSWLLGPLGPQPLGWDGGLRSCFSGGPGPGTMDPRLALHIQVLRAGLPAPLEVQSPGMLLPRFRGPHQSLLLSSRPGWGTVCPRKARPRAGSGLIPGRERAAGGQGQAPAPLQER